MLMQASSAEQQQLQLQGMPRPRQAPRHAWPPVSDWTAKPEPNVLLSGCQLALQHCEEVQDLLQGHVCTCSSAHHTTRGLHRPGLWDCRMQLVGIQANTTQGAIVAL